MPNLVPRWRDLFGKGPALSQEDHARLFTGNRRRSSRQDGYKYHSVPPLPASFASSSNTDNIPEEETPLTPRDRNSPTRSLCYSWLHWAWAAIWFRHRKVTIMMLGALGLVLFAYWTVVGATKSSGTQSCDHVETGYQCQPKISHFWGQYSPWYSIPSEINAAIPSNCQIDFVQLLSRHGCRDPTASKTKAYNATIQQLQANVGSFTGKYAFLADYEYTLGADQLTGFGQQEIINSGINFFNRYPKFSEKYTPFVRASGDDRVIETAANWTQGFHSAKASSPGNPSDSYPYNILVISEDDGSNNTLNHGTCTSFEDGYDSSIGDSAQAIFANIFVPSIMARLNNDLPGANLTATQTIYMMDLCPFNTIASSIGAISDFCDLFTESEWHSYDYYQSIGKYYNYGWGNPLGASQGVGFTNELIARLTASPVHDHTTTNSTLDSSKTTFPVGGSYQFFADFSHDNTITSIYAAMGLYNQTKPLSNTTVETVQQTNGYSAGWTVPFGSRMYVEKMTCSGKSEELVRVLVNDRVIPLQNCGADQLGRCKLSNFVNSLSFAREGGDWAQCWV